MTEKEKVTAAIIEMGKALEEKFPGVEFKITAEGKEPDKQENVNPLEKLLDSLNIQAPEALRTPAAHVELFRNSEGKLAAACVAPRKDVESEPDDIIERALKAIFAEENEDAEGDKGADACVCHHRCDCDGHDHCEPDDPAPFDPEVVPVSESSMINIYFGNNLEDIRVDRCGNASEIKMAAALLWAALDAMPDWPDEKWQDFLDVLDELAWMLARVEK